MIVNMKNRCIIALSWSKTGGCWAKGDSIKSAIAKLRAEGGPTGKGKVLLVNAPKDSWVAADGYIYSQNHIEDDGSTSEPQFNVDRQGRRVEKEQLV